MTILYQIGNSLYVNLTNKCSCACTFCVREKGEGVHGSDSLWLEKDITLEQALEAFENYDLDQYDAVVFCGYGEPLIKLKEVLAICQYIRSRSQVKLRINTNGLANLTHKKEVPPLFKGLVDSVSISLNAPNSKVYEQVCQPVYGERAYTALLDFAKGCKEVVRDVTFTVVEGTITEEQIKECKKIADKMEISFRVREWIS